jgi:hypothetical protein
VVNGGFENDSGWTFPVTDSTADYTTAEAHSGDRSARFGLLPGGEVATARSPGAPERTISSVKSLWLATHSPVAIRRSASLPTPSPLLLASGISQAQRLLPMTPSASYCSSQSAMG